jgi:hypothetical protein
MISSIKLKIENELVDIRGTDLNAADIERFIRCRATRTYASRTALIETLDAKLIDESAGTVDCRTQIMIKSDIEPKLIGIGFFSNKKQIEFSTLAQHYRLKSTDADTGTWALNLNKLKFDEFHILIWLESITALPKPIWISTNFYKVERDGTDNEEELLPRAKRTLLSNIDAVPVAKLIVESSGAKRKKASSSLNYLEKTADTLPAPKTISAPVQCVGVPAIVFEQPISQSLALTNSAETSGRSIETSSSSPTKSTDKVPIIVTIYGPYGMIKCSLVQEGLITWATLESADWLAGRGLKFGISCIVGTEKYNVHIEGDSAHLLLNHRLYTVCSAPQAVALAEAVSIPRPEVSIPRPEVSIPRPEVSATVCSIIGNKFGPAATYTFRSEYITTENINGKVQTIGGSNIICNSVADIELLPLNRTIIQRAGMVGVSAGVFLVPSKFVITAQQLQDDGLELRGLNVRIDKK